MNAEAEKVEVKFLKVLRKAKSGNLLKDIKEGYIYFDVHLDVNRKKIIIEKRVRLDKPERMLDKFMTKLTSMAEEKYKEQKYFVAELNPPELEMVLVDEAEVENKMLLVFEQVGLYLKTHNPATLKNTTVEF